MCPFRKQHGRTVELARLLQRHRREAAKDVALLVSHDDEGRASPRSPHQQRVVGLPVLIAAVQKLPDLLRTPCSIRPSFLD